MDIEDYQIAFSRDNLPYAASETTLARFFDGERDMERDVRMG
jgi:hypothetical protein